MRGCQAQYNYAPSWLGRAREYQVNLGGHDENLLVQSLGIGQSQTTAPVAEHCTAGRFSRAYIQCC